jgi:hypothetical protein
MLKLRNIFLIIIFCSITALPVTAQQNINNIETAFVDYSKYSSTEKVFTHTDKDFYLAGEIVWFKLYVVNAGDHKQIDLSKVAYVEILDKEQNPVLQAKIALGEGKGNGSLYLPFTLNSGVYKIRAYTSWMKNFSADYYFEKTITIINSLKNSVRPTRLTKDYDVQFFPEGGDLVQGIQSKVAFKIVDQYGKGANCNGFIVDGNNDTTVEFKPLKFGIGNFMFTPRAGNSYKAIIKLADTILTRNLPAPLEQGYVLKLNATDSSQLHVVVTTNIKTTGPVYLFVHTRQVSKIAEKGVLTNGVAEFIIDKSKLDEGVSHVTIFNSESQPVCERLFFKQPTQKLIIQPTVNEQEFSSRKKIELTVDAKDELQKPGMADMSVSVYRIDSLQSIQNEAIDNYLWLTSDLRGNIESPAYYFSEKNSEVDEATDNLMLTHGWRRYTWQDILQNKKPVYSFLPEYKGHIISGKLTNIKTGMPVANTVAYLSVPGARVQLYSSKSDSLGNINFYTKDFYGPNEIVLQTESGTDSIYKIELNSPFSDKVSTTGLPAFNLSSTVKNLLSDYNVSVQVQNNFSGEKLKQFDEPLVDSNAFFGKPDIQYLLDNYTRFSTMEEVLREYVFEVLVRRQKENFRFIVSDVDNKIFLEDPFTLINGVPVFDPNKIIKYDPLKVRKIDVVKRKYFYGPLILNGIINFITYQPDPDFNPSVLEYEGMQYHREFYSPVYETDEQISSRLPDFRNVLYWSPDIRTDTSGKAKIQFFTSDLKGKYVAILQGINTAGKVGEKTFLFEVK